MEIDMNNNHTITLRDKKWGVPMRVLTLINFFLASFTLVQCILLLLDYYNYYEISMAVVVLFLLITPFAFAASLCFAFGVHRICQGIGADGNIILGFAMMLLLAVDNLIYIPIHYRGENGDPVSFLILGGIELICILIFFLYYQNMGNKALAICAGVLLILSCGFEMLDAIRLVGAEDIDVSLDVMYHLGKKVLNTLIAVQSLIFVFGLNRSIKVKD